MDQSEELRLHVPTLYLQLLFKLHFIFILPYTRKGIFNTMKDTYFFVRHFRVTPLLSSAILEHGDESSETKVVVVLLGQLLHCQGV